MRSSKRRRTAPGLCAWTFRLGGGVRGARTVSELGGHGARRGGGIDARRGGRLGGVARRTPGGDGAATGELPRAVKVGGAGGGGGEGGEHPPDPRVRVGGH